MIRPKIDSVISKNTFGDVNLKEKGFKTSL